ncbi:MAG: DUF2911 domain-containing protein [Flavobacteriales bacterium]|nr:hypothetical protein [Flavobacteriales bacterium]MCC6577798.1 DUF2911 domain-containing protein [Flavobacteriales bacterium]NUQ15307.1 DUF2911 domain-containing protein [Flavobacteriales bacterium]
MKRNILLLAAALPLASQAQELPQPSPSGEIEQVIGLTGIEVDYSRPSARGRKVFGDLVPYGELWRTGANACTRVELGGPVIVGGKPVAKGSYCLFTIPGADQWTFILNADTGLWGTGGYTADKDVVRVTAKPLTTTDHVETFTIGFDAVRDDKAVLDLRWENTRVGIELAADATEQALANIKAAMAGSDLKAGNYGRSARYCVDKGVMLPEALTWAEKAVAMDRKYWHLHTLALAQAANGKYKEAVATANESMAMAQKESDPNYVKMNKARIEEWTGK